MKRLKSIVMAAVAVVIAATYTLLPALPAAAQSSSPGSAALSIAPKKNYVVEPGKSVKDTLVIRNLDSNSALNLTLRVVDFTFTDEGGSPKLFLDKNAAQTTWSLKPFLSVPETVSIAPGTSKTLNMSVSVPAGHGAGSFYSAIVYSTGTPDGGNVGLSASGVTLVFTQIPGKVNEDLKLQKLGAYESTTDKSNYVFITGNEPQKIAYTLKNNGNVVESPVGSIKVKNALFGQEYTIDNVNPNGSLALIGQSRIFTSCIKLKPQDVELGGTKSTAVTCTSPGLWPGLYNVSLDLFYGQNGNQTQEITGSASFWYLPGWFVLLVIVLLLVITFVIWRLVRFVRAKLGIRPKKSAPHRK